MTSSTTNILVCGIGGQGVMTATEILAEAAIAEGHDVKKTEVAGMSQRGGVVTSHLRFGPRVLSPQIAPGTAHVLLGLLGDAERRGVHTFEGLVNLLEHRTSRSRGRRALPHPGDGREGA